MQGFRGTGKTLMFGDGEEISNVANIHTYNP